VPWPNKSRLWNIVPERSTLISVSLLTAKRYWYGTFVPTICRSSHVNCGDTGDWIWMPFGVVSGVGLGMGVLDFGGDCRREKAVWGEYNAEMEY